MAARGGCDHAGIKAGLNGRLSPVSKRAPPRALDRDFDDELEFHRQMRLRKAREQGLSQEAAEREAKLRWETLRWRKMRCEMRG